MFVLQKYLFTSMKNIQIFQNNIYSVFRVIIYKNCKEPHKEEEKFMLEGQPYKWMF